eukprot:3565169-Pleurochrysis_carterae.AAC.1
MALGESMRPDGARSTASPWRAAAPFLGTDRAVDCVARRKPEKVNRSCTNTCRDTVVHAYHTFGFGEESTQPNMADVASV